MRRASEWLWPASLAGRITLTMLAGLLAIHLGSLRLLEQGVLGAAGDGREEQVAERLATARRTIGSLPEEVRGTAAGALSSPDLDIAWHRAASAAAPVEQGLEPLRARLREDRAAELTGGTPAEARRTLDGMVALERAARRDALRGEIRAERDALRTGLPIAGPMPRWDDFLREQAKAGDQVAAREYARLARRTGHRPAQAVPAIQGKRGPDRARPTPGRSLADMTLHRDRFGALAYRWGEDVALRDTGREIQVVSGAADAARAGLLIGAEKFAALTLIGTDAFKAQVVRLAVAEGLAHRIANPELQDRIEAERSRAGTGGPAAPSPGLDARAAPSPSGGRQPMNEEQRREAARRTPAAPPTPDQAHQREEAARQVEQRAAQRSRSVELVREREQERGR